MSTMHQYIFLALFLILTTNLKTTHTAECHGKPSPNAQPNLLPIYTSPPQFVKSVKNGKLYTIGENDDIIPIVHIWGTPYEMGYAHGQLMKEKTQGLVTDVWNYMIQQVEDSINGTVNDVFPQWFLQDVSDMGLEVALDLETDVTKRYTGEYFYEELKGLSEGSGASYKTIERIHMIGELTKGSCSMFGANDSAVLGGGLLQLRALDWNVDGPFKNYPQITVYHPTDPKNGHSFANIGFTGWIGSITGFNSLKMAISEIGVSFPDSTFGHESRFGIPFTYILRDILQFDKSLKDAMNRISSAHRTCNLILGVGDGKANQFRGVEYSASTADFFTWDILRPAEDWHPKIQDIVYWGMDWLCPGFNEVLARQLTRFHGNLTAEITIREVVPIVQTGDLHIAVYDLTNDIVYISYARGEGETGPQYAYDRTFMKLNTKDLFAEMPPKLI